MRQTTLRPAKLDPLKGVFINLENEMRAFQLGPKWQASRNIARHRRCVVTYSCSALLNERDQHPVGLLVLSVCSYRRKHSAFISQASESTVLMLCERRRALTKSSPNVTLRVSKAVIFSSVSLIKVGGWPFQSFIFKDAATPTKFGRNRQKSWHKPRISRVLQSWFRVQGCK